MLDDLCSSAAKRSARRRFGGSIAVALLVHCGVGAAMLVTKATARHVVEDELTEIEIVTELPPEPPPVEAPTAEAPPEELAAPAPAPRPRAKPPELAPPQEAPSEQPAEPAAAEALLAEAGPTGPVAAGVAGGVIGGTGTAVMPASGTALVATAPAPAPAPRPEPLVPPVEQAGNPHPRYSLLAKRNGIEGLVVVTFEVLEDGRVASPRIISGPEELYESVLKAVTAWRFQPARRGQAAVRHKVTKQIRFRLQDA
jgi:protein TonB